MTGGCSRLCAREAGASGPASEGAAVTVWDTHVAAAALANPVEAHDKESSARHGATEAVHERGPGPAQGSIRGRPANERDASDSAVENEADGEEEESDRHQGDHEDHGLPVAGDSGNELWNGAVLCRWAGPGGRSRPRAHFSDLEGAQRRRWVDEGPIPLWVRIQPRGRVVEAAHDFTRGGHAKGGTGSPCSGLLEWHREATRPSSPPASGGLGTQGACPATMQ